MQQIDLSES